MNTLPPKFWRAETKVRCRRHHAHDFSSSMRKYVPVDTVVTISYMFESLEWFNIYDDGERFSYCIDHFEPYFEEWQ